MWGTYGAPDMTHTHVIHRHLQTHTNTFNLQSEMYTHTHTHILARLGSCRNWSDGFWLIVCKCWNIINPFFFCHLEWCMCMHVWVCVCLWEIISGRWREPRPLLQGQQGEVNQHRLLHLLLPSFPVLSPFLSSLHPSKSTSTPTYILSAHSFSVSFFIMSCLRKTKRE